jgi:hypothetical protein
MAGIARALCLAVVGVLVLLVLAAAAVAARRYDRYLAGFWVGEASFLEEAGLRSFRLFLAPRDAPRGDRQGYLIIEDSEGGLVANGALELTPPALAPARWGAARAFLARDDTLRLHGVAAEFDEDDSPLPPEFSLAVSLQEGSLTIYDHEKVYAFLRKDHATSAAAVAAYVA